MSRQLHRSCCPKWLCPTYRTVVRPKSPNRLTTKCRISLKISTFTQLTLKDHSEAMAPTLLPSIDIEKYTTTGVLSPQQLSYLGSVFAPIDSKNVEYAFLHLQQTFGLFETYFGAWNLTGTGAVEDIVSLLDSGAAKVFVSQEQYLRIQAIRNLDLSRVAVNVAQSKREDVQDSTSNYPGGICIEIDVDWVEDWVKEHGQDDVPIYAFADGSDEEKILKVVKLGGVPVIDMVNLSADKDKHPDHLDAAAILMAGTISDRPDGLFTTLVTDERGIALGLVYSSEKSVSESFKMGQGVYQSRKRGLWYKGESSGDTQELVRITLDCDRDTLRFVVRQKGRGFCHTGTATCFGEYHGLARLQKTLKSRKESAPEGSYTARLFNDPLLLRAKIMEEADELCEANSKDDVAFEAADLMYFALTKCIASGVSLEDVEQNLDAKSQKVKRRRGDAKPQWTAAQSEATKDTGNTATNTVDQQSTEEPREAASVPEAPSYLADSQNDRIQMKRFHTSSDSVSTIHEALKRPSQRSSEKIMGIVNPIIKDVCTRGDTALLEYTHKFEKATSLTTPIIKAPFPESLMRLEPKTIEAIDISFENIRKFHAAQKEEKPLTVETMPGVVCQRFARPVERVGLYVPGGTAVLPSTAMMLGVPAMVAGCKTIVIASPPRADGSVTPEIVYVAHKVGAESIVLAGGAQAVAAMAYGTERVSKVDKILGPGNQFVTAAKMVVANDTDASVAIDMPAGPSEVLVIADETANPAFVASDLLSQAEHGTDSQVVCIAVNLSKEQIAAIEDELHKQASALPRVDIVRGAIEHSVTLVVKDIDEAMQLSNFYAPEHLILQVKDAEKVLSMVQNAGSVFVGPWTPESVGDYSAGVNHSLRMLMSAFQTFSESANNEI